MHLIECFFSHYLRCKNVFFSPFCYITCLSYTYLLLPASTQHNDACLSRASPTAGETRLPATRLYLKRTFSTLPVHHARFSFQFTALDVCWQHQPFTEPPRVETFVRWILSVTSIFSFTHPSITSLQTVWSSRNWCHKCPFCCGPDHLITIITTTTTTTWGVLPNTIKTSALLVPP